MLGLADIDRLGDRSKQPLKSNGPDSNAAGFQLLARSEPQEVQVGAQVVIQLTVRNNSKELLMFHDLGLFVEMFDMEVRNGAGELMPLTRYGQMNLARHTAKRTGEIALSIRSWKLKPGEEETFFLLANQIYDMSVSGGYFITVKRHFFSKVLKKAVEVSSNPTKVDVSYFDFRPPSNPVAAPPAESDAHN